MPTINQRGDSVPARQYDYDDATLLMADFGPGTSGSVEILDEMAIVVIERDGESHQHEFDLPGEVGEAFMKNGVVTIEVIQ